MAVICVSNQKGGTGKTSVTLNLIHHLNPKQIIDLDVHGGLSKLNQLRGQPLEIKVTKKKSELLDWLDTKDLTIVDCGGFDSELIRYALSQSDYILTPSTDDPTDQFALVDFNNVIKEVSNMVGEKLCAYVLHNKVHHSRNDFSDMDNHIDQLDHLKLCPVRINASASIPSAAFSGESVKSGTVAAQFSFLSKHIFEKVG